MVSEKEQLVARRQELLAELELVDIKLIDIERLEIEAAAASQADKAALLARLAEIDAERVKLMAELGTDEPCGACEVPVAKEVVAEPAATTVEPTAPVVEPVKQRSFFG